MACQCQQLPVGAHTAPTYLPSSCTKHGDWTEYSSATEAGLEVAGRAEDILRLWKLRLPNIQIKNLPIYVSAKCEHLHTEMNHTSSEFQNLNITFAWSSASHCLPQWSPPQILEIVSVHSVG